MTELSYPEDLPITALRRELVEAIAAHQVVIVAGETGSGKSTQLPKLCLEAGRGTRGMIGHTQPRRVAARSIAERVAEELGTELGGMVGYAVRFTDRVGRDTRIKVLTDGLLLAEIRRDRRLSRYDTLIVDEAHERSLNIDFLLGYLSDLLPRRRDLKLVITSATIDTERFADHFDAPVVEVSGRSYPVEVRYRPLDEVDQPQGICNAVEELFSEGTGDVLVFCSGEREIRDAAEAIAELALPRTEILPLYARLSAAEQHRVFERHPGRRIVLATNVAETSLTVPGIRSVVDPGTARISRFNRRTKVQRLPIEPISRASAEQRAGRCGRLGPGICIRLYSEEELQARPEFTEPEIQRTNLASVILQMAELELGDIEGFPFIDPPDLRAIRDGIVLLEELGAVHPGRERGKGWITDRGRRMARLPLDPRLARMVLEAHRTGCLGEVLVIVAALAVQDPRDRPTGREEQADQAHARFRHPSSDLLGWLRLWEHVTGERQARTSSGFRRMCRDEYLNYRRLREWQDVHTQLRQVAKELGLVVNRPAAPPDVIHRALLTGLLSQVGVRDPKGFDYRGPRGTRFSVSPGSTLFKRAPEWVMAAELVETTRMWARGVAGIQPEWVERAAADLVKRSHSDPWWDARGGSAVANETVTLYGLTLAVRVVQYGRIDREAARRLFIRHALVEGEWDTHHDFVTHNRHRIEEVRAMEARGRVDLLIGEDGLFDLYAARIPDDIATVRHFDRWWRDTREHHPHLLDLAVEELIRPGAGPPDDEAFPEVWWHGELALPIEYTFDPGTRADGLTIEVPVGALERLDPAAFGWQVPGRRHELVEALIRSMPKHIRTRFAPIPDTARKVVERLEPGEGGVVEAVRRELSQLSGELVPPGAIDPEAVPAHLRPGFRVVGADGTVLAKGPDLADLKRDLSADLLAAAPATGHEQSGLLRWSIGELPRQLTVGGVTAYPALIDEGATVGVRLLATRAEQAEAMWTGTRRLLILGLASPSRLLRSLLTDAARRTVGGIYQGPADWGQDCLTAAVDGILAEAGGPVWEAVAFDRLLAVVKNELADRLTVVARRSLEILNARASLVARLARPAPAPVAAALADMTTQLDQLVYPGFVTGVGSHLHEVARYVRAIEHRLGRLPADPARDARLMETIHRLEADHDHLLDNLPPSPELMEIAWMLQELRVSLFAQSLGTNRPVSEKRVRAALAAAAGG